MNCPICNYNLAYPRYCDHWIMDKTIKICYDRYDDGSYCTEVFSLNDIYDIRRILKINTLISLERIEKLLLLK